MESKHEWILIIPLILGLVLPAHTQTFAPIRITGDVLDQTEPTIVISPLSVLTQLVGWNDFEDGFSTQPGYAFSIDAGANWSLGILPDINPSLVSGFDPSVAFDRNGYAYYCYIARNGILGGVYVSRTSNLGDDWTHHLVSPVTVNQDKPYMAVDNTGIPGRDGRIYVSWTDFSGTGTKILFRFSSDQGQTWNPTPPHELTTAVANHPALYSAPVSTPTQNPGLNVSIVQGSIPAVALNGDIYVIWTRALGSINGDSATVEMRKSTDGGETFAAFDPDHPVASFKNVWWDIGGQEVRSFLHASIATDPTNANRVYVTYTDQNDGNWLGMCARTTDGGSNWLSPVRSAPIPTLYGYQYFQSIAVYPSGKISVVFFNSDDQANFQARLAESVDNGATDFTGLTDPLSALSDANNGERSYHYIGNASASQYTFPVWVNHQPPPPDPDYNVDIYWACINRPNTSNLSYATAAGGGGRKTTYTTSDSRWHSVFQSNGTITYSSSTSEGVYWLAGNVNGSVVLNEKSSPALVAYDNADPDAIPDPYVVFTAGSGLYLNRKIAEAWLTQPYQLITTNLETPSFAIDNSGYGHVVWVYNPAAETGGGPQYKLWYGKFSTAGSPPTLTDQVALNASSSVISAPAITLDSNQKPHVVWSVGGEIYYRNKTGSSWSTTENISNTSGTSQNPTLSNNGTTVYASWQEDVGGYDDIYYRVRTGSWGAPQNINNSAGIASVTPTMQGPVAGFPVIVWSEYVSETNWDIKFRWMGSADIATISATNGVSSFPSFAFRMVTSSLCRLYAIWTEGSGAPFQIPPVTRDFSTIPTKESVLAEANLPTVLRVQNYPNPFNPTTTLSYDLPASGLVSLVIFDVLGREITALVDGYQEAGHHSLEFDGRGLASGVYIYRLSHGGEITAGKMLLAR